MKVLVIDDSAVARQILGSRLATVDIEVLASPTLDLARQRVRSTSFDVVILDLELGERVGAEPAGLRLLAELVALRVPTLVCSSLTQRGSEIAMRALTLGAADVLDKAEAFAAPEGDLRALVRALARPLPRKTPVPGARRVPAHQEPGLQSESRAPVGVVCIGSSTGGIEPLSALCSAQTDDDPPFLVVQHIAAAVLPAFLRQLQQRTGRRVVEVTDGVAPENGKLYFAAPGRHLLLTSDDGDWRVTTNEEPPVRYHRPSIDVLFRAVARVAWHRAIAFLLSGMGGDGADGLGAILRAGGYTVAQDEASSVVYGMAREAVERGHVRALVPADALPRTLRAALRRSGGAAEPLRQRERSDG